LIKRMSGTQGKKIRKEHTREENPREGFEGYNAEREQPQSGKLKKGQKRTGKEVKKAEKVWHVVSIGRPFQAGGGSS